MPERNENAHQTEKGVAGIVKKIYSNYGVERGD